jgi:phasin family protein
MINPRLSQTLSSTADQIRSQARAYGATALDAARQSALRAANRVDAVKRPVRVLADASLRLSSLSGRYVERILGRQAELIDAVIDDGARRLKAAADADSLGSFIEEQREMTGTSRQRLGKELRAAWGITKASGRELRDLATETYAEVVHGRKVAARKPRAKRSAKARTARKHA